MPEKGLLYLLKALDIVVHKDKYEQVRLLMIDDGPQRSLILKLSRRYKLENNIVLLGFLSRRKVAEYLSKASIFLSPSIREGMPISLLETLFSGLPIIGTRISGVRDLVIHGYNGLLVPSKNFRTLATAISYLLENEDLRNRTSKNARRYVVANFDYQRVLP